MRCGLLFASSVSTGRSVCAGREGSRADDCVTRGGDGTLFQGLRQQCTASRATRRSDYYLHGAPNKDDAVPPALPPSLPLSSCLLLFLPRHPSSSGDVTSLFADILFAAGCTEGLLFFRVCEPPQIFTCGITTAQHGKENIQGSGAKEASLLASVIVPELLSPSPSLARRSCVWQARLLNPRAFAA